MSEIPKNNKIKILGYKPIKATITKKPRSKIKLPPIQDRFNPSVEDDLTMDQIEDTPIPALYCPTLDEFFVVEMLDIFIEGTKRKVKELTLFVIGEIKQPDDSAIPRLQYILKPHKRFHPLEKVRAIDQAKKLNYSDCGVYGYGGDRRSAKASKKVRLNDRLKQTVPYCKQYEIEALHRFGDHIGPVGIEGLYRLLKYSGEDLLISKIHEKNPKLNRIGLRGKIDAEIDRLKGAKHNDDEIKEAIGIMVHDALFEKDAQPTPMILAPNIADGGGDGDGDNTGSGKKRRKAQNHCSAKDSGGKDGNGNGANSDPVGGDEDDEEDSSIAEFYPVNRKDLTRAKKMLRPVCKKVNKIESKYKPMRELSSNEAEELWEEIDDLTTLLSKYKMVLFKAVFGK